MREAGPFCFQARCPGMEAIIPDYDRINPDYFVTRSQDRLSEPTGLRSAHRGHAQGCHRGLGPIPQWPDSYTRYIEYVWSRYQANVCIYSPIHYDWVGMAMTERELNTAANQVIEMYGPPPFGTLATCNSSLSSQVNFGQFKDNRWLTLQQIGNWREHVHYWYLTEVFHTEPAVPHSTASRTTPGTRKHATTPTRTAPRAARPQDDMYVRSTLYGSLLSGGLGGYVYGTEGIWGADIEKGSDPAMWESFQWGSAKMRPTSGHVRLVRGQSLSGRWCLTRSWSPRTRPTTSTRTRDGPIVPAQTPRTLSGLLREGLSNGHTGPPTRQDLSSRLVRSPQGQMDPGREKGTLDSDRWGRIAVPRLPTPEDWGLKLVLN